MVKTFRHSGKIGDVIFSLPTIREMGGGILYLPSKAPESTGLYENMRSLLLQQPFIQDVKEYPSGYSYEHLAPDPHIDIDLDQHRTHPLRGRVNMVKRYFEVFGIDADWKQPWLTVEGEPPISGEYSLINLTPRFRDHSTIDWRRVYNAIPGRKIFVGTPQEYAHFVEKVSEIEYFETKDLLTLALTIRYSLALYCNQSCALSLAQGLQKNYHLEKKPGKTNCLFYTPNEFILI
jgi:hypothetical protein